MEKKLNKFAERLKELREEKSLSQRSLAKQIDVSQACISRWENGEIVPTIDNIIILTQFFGVTSDYIIGLED